MDQYLSARYLTIADWMFNQILFDAPEAGGLKQLMTKSTLKTDDQVRAFIVEGGRYMRETADQSRSDAHNSDENTSVPFARRWDGKARFRREAAIISDVCLNLTIHEQWFLG